MQKILLSLLTVGLVASVAFGATRAYFSDTETSTGNTFAAGTLDLKVDDANDSNVVHVTLSNMKPGDTATYSWTLKNAGSVAGKPWVEIKNVSNLENLVGEPEAVVDTTIGADEGELGANLVAQIRDQSIGYVYYMGSRFQTINAWEGKTVGKIAAPQLTQEFSSLGAGATDNVYFELSIDNTVGNIIQSDSLEFDVVFHLEQV